MNHSRLVSKIINESLVLDAHFDLLMDVQEQREKGRTKVIETKYYPRFVAGGIHAIIASVFIDSCYLPEMGLRKALGQISALYEEVKESPDLLMICYSAEDMKRAKETGKIGFMLSLEGAEPIGTDLSLMRVFYELGVRNLGLVWSRRNAVGDGSFFMSVREGRKGGITSFGVQVIEEAERLGIMIDVSHLNDEGFWDVMELSKKPIIASHSNARSLCSTMRNLTHEQIKAIASKKGVIGINANSLLVGDDDSSSNLNRLLDHIDYLVNLAGIHHVGIGMDLCDDFMELGTIIANRRPFDIISGHQSFPNLLEGLLKRGYTEEMIKLIVGENFIRIF